MEHITRFAINNSRATILAIFLLIFLGIQTFSSMPSQEDPEITVREAQISAYFQGMAPDQVENLIAKPIEKKIKEIPELKKITTKIKNGEAIINVSIQDKYYELAPIWQNLRNKMNDLKSSLPQGIIGPLVNDDFGRVAAVTIAMTGDGFNMREMRDISFDLQDNISNMPSVSKVSLLGIQKEKIYIEIDPARLSQYGIAFSQIINELTNQNIVSPSGSINAGGYVIDIETSGNIQSIDEIKNIQLKVPNREQVVYLQDIATIRRSYVEPAEYEAFYNNKPAIIIAVSMVPHYNIENFGKEINAKIEAIKRDLPLGLELNYATYQPALVKKAIDSAINNLYQTIAVVLAVVIIFLGVRTGLIVSAIVPLTILLSFIFMNLWGIDLQRMSIAAIIISLGLLVDNAIVIAEDIKTRINNGEEKKHAAIYSVKTLGMPLLTSSLTTILAFMPLMLANDTSGEYLRSLSQVVITTLLSSWFLAIFATPALCYWFLPDSDKKLSKNNLSTNDKTSYDGFLYKFYHKSLLIVMKFRVIFIGFLVALLIISLMALGNIPRQMMPYSDRNQFLVYLDLPAGSHVSETRKVTRRLTKFLADKQVNPEIQSNIAYIGYGGPRFFLALSPPDPADNVAFIVINTDGSKDILKIIAKVDQYIFENLPEASGRSKRMSLGAGEIGIVEYRISGTDIATIYKIGAEIEATMKNINGSVGVTNNWDQPVIRTTLNIDQDRARRAGITSKDIASALSGYLKGVRVSDYRENDKIIPIVIRGDAKRDNWAALEVLPIKSKNGSHVLLAQVATIDGYIAPGKFVRINQKRTMTVSGKHQIMQASEFHQNIWKLIENIQLPQGYEIAIGGEVENSSKGNSALAANMPFAFIGIIILLVLQFNSVRRPIIILLTIPLVIIGAVLGLIVSNAFFSFTALLGIYSLVGIIVNNGIVLIDRIDIERDQGFKINTAIINACLARMRPILITSLTTILGLIPMALFGGAMWFPMAVVIMGGLAIASILTLGFVPVLYSIFFKDQENKN